MATAVQVEALWSGLTDNSGSPLAAGKVFTYYAGTSTPVSLYTSSDKSTNATNPIILDGNGRAQVWADGRYKFVVKTSSDTSLYTLDNLIYGFDDSTAIWCGAATGTGNAVTVSAPSVTQYTEGTVSFVASATNTGPVTVNLNSLGAVALVKGADRSPLVAGDIAQGQLVTVAYEVFGGVGRYRLTDYPTVADIQHSRMVTATNVAGTNVITADLTPSFYQYETGQVVRFKAAATNTGSVTMNLNGKGAKAVQWNNQALLGGELVQNHWYQVVYDGTQFQLLFPVNSAAPLWAGTSSGTSTAYQVAPSPAISAYVSGQRVSFIPHAANGAAPTLSVSGLTGKSIFDQTTLASIGANRLVSGRAYEAVYDGTQFRLCDNVGDTQNGDYIWLGTTAGSATAQTAIATPAITAYKAGQKFRAKIGASLGSTGTTNTPHTININSIGAKNIVQLDSTNPTAGTWVAGALVELVYDGTTFVLVNNAGGWQAFNSTGTLTAPSPMTISGIGFTISDYIKLNKQVTVIWEANFTIGGTLGQTLNFTPPVASPLSQATTGQVIFGNPVCVSGGSQTIGLCYFSTSGSNITFTRDQAATNWATGAGTVRFAWTYRSV